MPCEQCEEGLYKWGETGECLYKTLEDCQTANQDAYLEETLKPKSDIPVDWTYNFTEEQMEALHEEGELLVEVEKEEDAPDIPTILWDIERKLTRVAATIPVSNESAVANGTAPNSIPAIKST